MERERIAPRATDEPVWVVISFLKSSSGIKKCLGEGDIPILIRDRSITTTTTKFTALVGI